jgi:TolA-binding protein
MKCSITKKFAVAVSAVLLLAGSEAGAQAKPPSIDELQERGGVYYNPKTKQPYTGKVFLSECTDECEYDFGGVAEMSNGKFHGKYVVYNIGQTWNETNANYINGKLHGKWTRRDMGGVEVGNYVDDKQHGEWVHHDRDINTTVKNYKNGVLQDSTTMKTVDFYTKQLTKCKGDNCAEVMSLLSEACSRAGNHSMAIQTYQRLLKEHPHSKFSKNAKNALTDAKEAAIRALPREQQQAAWIEHYKEELSVCKGDTCALIMLKLGGAYYQQTVDAKGSDYSMAIQTYQRLLKEHQKSQYLQETKDALANAVVAGISALPSEQQPAAWVKYYKTQLAECTGDTCANIMEKLGDAYHKQAKSEGTSYSMAIQTLQQLVKEYPKYIRLNGVMDLLARIENNEQQRQETERKKHEAEQKKIEQQQEAERKKAEQQKVLQSTIDQNNKLLAECKGDNCANILSQLGSAYYQLAFGTGGDYSMAIQTYQRLATEYPAKTWWSTAKYMLMEIEIASLPPEQRTAARPQAQAKLWQETIDHYNKQLSTCKGDNCAVVISSLGSAYYSQQASLGAEADYSLAIKMYERLIKEYPNHVATQSAKQMLTTIENMPKKSQ